VRLHPFFFVFRHSANHDAYNAIRSKLTAFRNAQLGYGVSMTGVCFLPIFIPAVEKNVYIILGIFNFVVVNAAYTLIANRKDEHFRAKIEDDNIHLEFDKKEQEKNMELQRLNRGKTTDHGHIRLNMDSSSAQSVHSTNNDGQSSAQHPQLQNSDATLNDHSPLRDHTPSPQPSSVHESPKIDGGKEIYNPFVPSSPSQNRADVEASQSSVPPISLNRNSEMV